MNDSVEPGGLQGSPAPDGLLIIAGSFDARGGLQRRLLQLATTFTRDCAVTVVTWKPFAIPHADLRQDELLVITMPSLLTWDRDHHPAVSAINTAFTVATSVMAALASRGRWSIAYAAGLHPEGTVAALAARGRRFVVNVWLTGPFGNAQRLSESPGRRVVLRLLRRAHQLLPQTPTGANELLDLNLPAERVRVLETGIDLRVFAPRSRAPVSTTSVPYRAVYAGRFDLRQKCLRLLLDAWRAAELRDWKLVLVGAGTDDEAVRRAAAEYADVEVMDWQEDVAPLLGTADCFVLPTVAEERPTAMLEGMACGLPGVVSAVGGVVDLEPDGVLLVDNDVQAWASALRALDALGPRGRRLAGRRARAWAETHADRRDEIARLRELMLR